jgi:hypothetical protein
MDCARAPVYRPAAHLAVRLIPNWRAVLTRAWSVRLMVLAFVLTVAEVALPLLDGYLPIPQYTFAALSGLATAGAFIARLVAQQNLGAKE